MDSIRENLRFAIMVIATILFTASLFDAIYGFKNLINPGISLIYNAVGTQLAPNMVTLVVFDWRGFDTLGESLILVTAVLVVLLIFGKGKILDKNINADSLTESNIQYIQGVNDEDTDYDNDVNSNNGSNNLDYNDVNSNNGSNNLDYNDEMNSNNGGDE